MTDPFGMIKLRSFKTQAIHLSNEKINSSTQL